MIIIRGTTPTIVFTFKTIVPSTEVETAYFTIKQAGREKVSKPFSDAVVTENTIEWTLTQEESLNLSIGRPADIHCDWVANDGTRGGSKPAICDIVPAGKEEVI